MIAIKEEIKVLLTDMKWESSKEPQTPSLGNTAECLCVGAHQGGPGGTALGRSERVSQGRFLGLPVRFRILTWPFPCLLDLPLHFKMATNTSSRIFENMERNCFHVLWNNLQLTLSVLRLLVAHRRPLRVGSGTTGFSLSGMGF